MAHRWLTALGLVAVVACAGAKTPGPGEAIGESLQKRPTAVSADGGEILASANPLDKETLEQKAARLHRSSIVVDTHNDIPSVMYAARTDLGAKSAWTHTDLARLKTGGVTATFFSIFVEADLAEKPTALGGGPLRRALDLIDTSYRQVERYPEDLMLATSAADIRRAKREDKMAVLMGVEGGHAIENSLGALRELYRLGVRYMTLTHTNTNDWADSAGFSGPTPVKHHGLTPFGEEVVREMQRIGMLVDVSHTSDETFNAALRIAQAPVIASHSSARALADHRRNLSDDMLRALAKNGGVAMVNFWSLFLSNDYAVAAKAWNEKNGKAATEIRAKHRNDPLGYREEMAKLKATDPVPKVPFSVLVDHIEHMVKVAGVDHVGLGSDFDGVDELPDGITGVDGFPRLTLELLRRGMPEEDVKKILGENFLRAFEKAEAFSKTKNTRLSGDGSLVRIDRP